MSPPKIPIGQDFTSATEKNLTTETDDAIFHYRLDDIAVTEGIFDAEDSTLHILLTDSLPQSGKSVFTINAFTTAQKMVDFGINHSIPIAQGDSLERALFDYAQSSGAIIEEEQTDTVPQHFIDFAELTIAKSSLIGISTVVYTNNCSSGSTGLLTTYKGFKAKITWPFNDNIERFHNGPLAPLVHNRVYARTWFRTKMLSTWLVYSDQVCFQGPLAGLADRASSWVALN